jgi:hypothetical protein
LGTIGKLKQQAILIRVLGRRERWGSHFEYTNSYGPWPYTARLAHIEHTAYNQSGNTSIIDQIKQNYEKSSISKLIVH